MKSPPPLPAHIRDARILAASRQAVGQETRPVLDTDESERHPAERTTDEIPAAVPEPIVDSSAVPDSIYPGVRIHQYEIIRLLGRGGMGSVHLARDLRLGRRVAIKFLTNERADVTRRFMREAQATARCRHENIVVIYDVGEYEGRPYMVLEYLEGQTLREWLEHNTQVADPSEQRLDAPRTPISPERAVELITPVVRALVHAHQAGIVHRDLKPANILLTNHGEIKVLDFGIATLRATSGVSTSADNQDSTNPTHLNKLVGTVAYMSPEQLDTGDVDHRTDLWAVGLMLYEMVVGHLPLPNLTASDLFALTDVDTPLPSVSEKRPDLGPLAGIIDRCLIKNSKHRTASAQRLLSELTTQAQRAPKLSLPDNRNPFAGLAAFQEDDANRFFGREPDIINIATRLRTQPVVAVVGPSGLGKSSLVRAGVIPALKWSGEAWDVHTVRPGRRPLSALAEVLHEPGGSHVKVGDQSGLLASIAKQRERLRTTPGVLGASLRARTANTRRRALLFIDQFEELFTLGADPDEIRAFIACLDGVADDASSPLRLIVCLRSDYLDRVAEHRAFMTRMTPGLLFIPPLDRDALTEALDKPVRAAGYSFESQDMVDEMVEHVANAPETLPLMQFAAAHLWGQRDRNRRALTRKSYDAMGGLVGTLASHADTVLAGMGAAEKSLARQLVMRLVTPERTRAVVDMDELRQLGDDPEATETLIQKLVDARLIMVHSSDDRPPTVEAVHESLITSWPRLQRWLDENREDSAFLDRLRSAAHAWERGRRAEGLLWRGLAARESALWHERYQGELTALERAYLKAVLSLAGRLRLIRRVALVSMVVFLSVLLILALLAKQNSDQQAERLLAQEHELIDAVEKEQKAAAEARRAAEDARQARDQSRKLAEEAQRERDKSEKLADERSEATQRARKSLRRVKRSRRKLAQVVELEREARQRAQEAEQRASRALEAQRRMTHKLQELIRRANDGRVRERLSN